VNVMDPSGCTVPVKGPPFTPVNCVLVPFRVIHRVCGAAGTVLGPVALVYHWPMYGAKDGGHAGHTVGGGLEGHGTEGVVPIW
jgi:hypothetical protein